MQSPSRKNESGAPEPAAGTAVAAAKRAKLSVMLVTGDDMLWPQVGPHLSGELILKQVDSIDELLTATAPGQPAIVLWDARGEAAAAAVLTRLQLHSACFAVVALDDAGNAAAWTNPVGLRQIIAQAAVPVLADALKAALESAREEVLARTALLGDGNAATHGAAARGAAASAAGARRFPWIPAAVILGVLIASVVAFLLSPDASYITGTTIEADGGWS